MHDAGVRHYMFVDRLAGKAYSKGNYDGIDVSRHQGAIKWREVAKDKKIKFVYIRATMGKSHPDDFYRRNVKLARQAGLKVGSYHFQTSKYSVTEQFRDFLSKAKPDEQDLIRRFMLKSPTKSRFAILLRPLPIMVSSMRFVLRAQMVQNPSTVK